MLQVLHVCSFTCVRATILKLLHPYIQSSNSLVLRGRECMRLLIHLCTCTYIHVHVHVRMSLDVYFECCRINEGFTTYLERRIAAKLFSEEERHLQALSELKTTYIYMYMFPYIYVLTYVRACMQSCNVAYFPPCLL